MYKEIVDNLKEAAKSRLTGEEKKNVLIELVKQADREEILDIAYELGQCSSGYYQEDKRKSKKQWILDILEYSYDTNDNLSRYQERSNTEIENAIFNGTHKDIVEYFDLEVY